MIKLIAFDLDDTLYDEATFVESGFLEVANFLAKKFDFNKKEVFKIIKQNYQQYGRGKVFNYALKQLKIKSTKSLIFKLISVYRLHDPKIKTFPGIKPFLLSLKKKNIFLILITDTRWSVQFRKVKTLDIK